MSPSVRTVVHIGFPKSASSSLQNLWYASATAYFSGKRPRASGRRFVTKQLDTLLRRRITSPDDADFDLAAARRTVDRVKGKAERAGHDTLLVSAEGLSGVTFARYGSPSAPFDVILTRLLGAFGPDITIFMVVREQRSLLKSYYGQLVKQGYAKSFRTFLARNLGLIEGMPLDSGLLPRLCFGRLIAGTRAAGVECLWMPMEYLVTNQGALPLLAKRLGFDFDAALPHVNRKGSPGTLERRLRRNRRRGGAKYDSWEGPIVASYDAEQDASPNLLSRGRRLLNPLGLASPAACDALANDHDAALARFFAADNSQLQTMGEHDLRAYGYALDEPSRRFSDEEAMRDGIAYAAHAKN